MRGRYEGSVPRPHASGGYAAQLKLPGQPRKTIYGKTAAEVNRKKREMVRRYEDGQPLTDSRAKVAAWVKVWSDVTLEMRTTRDGELAESTKDIYRDLAQRFVVPVIGGLDLGKVGKTECESVLVAMKKAGLGGSYQRMVYTVLRSIFDAAKSGGKIASSPMAEVDRPAVPDHEAAYLSREQAADLVAALKAGPPQAGDVWLDIVQLCLLTGLRRGEALGLRWEDVKDDVLELRVQTTRTKGGLAQRRLKTRGSKRDIDITSPLAAVLRRRRKAQLEDRMKAPVGTWTETGLVFTTRLGTAIEPNNVNRAFRAAVRRAGLPTTGEGRVTPHTLRHSAATLLLESGVSMKEVQKILGHGKLATTMDIYGHVSPERRAAAMAKLGEALGWD